MKSQLTALAVITFLSFFCESARASDGDARKPETPTAEQIRFFESRIRPLLADQCNDCHGVETQESNLRLDTLGGMLRGGKAGPVIVPGKPKSSLLVTAVSYQDTELRMPPEEKLSAQQIKDLTRWVEMGAPHPDSGTVTPIPTHSGVDFETGRKHWAFQPPVKPDAPKTDPLHQKSNRRVYQRSPEGRRAQAIGHR